MHLPTIIASVLLAAAAAFAITTLGQPPAAPMAPDATSEQGEIAALREQVQQLQQQLEGIAQAAVVARPQNQRIEAPTVSSAQVAAAVEAYLKDRTDTEALAASLTKDGKVDLAAVYSDLSGTSFFGNAEAWKKAFAEGRMDELIERFEADAAANPNDPAAQMALANAYLAYLQMDQSKWQLSMKADESFDRVLNLDERHWEARFSKAVSYTFWPEFLGKKQEAIANFETLVAQQEGTPAQEHESQTYLYLGNLLEGKEPERAREIWQRGLQRHPNNAELLERLGR